tara:strand:+ start:248 stop:430 length:183 start_codon:yes stop_codon:yes gene_type:complete
MYFSSGLINKKGEHLIDVPPLIHWAIDCPGLFNQILIATEKVAPLPQNSNTANQNSFQIK